MIDRGGSTAREVFDDPDRARTDAAAAEDGLTSWERAWLERHVPPGPIVVVGAGTGREARALAAAGRRVLALEPAHAMVARRTPAETQAHTSASGGGVCWVRGAVPGLPVADLTAAGILVTHGLPSWVGDRHARDRLYSELLRCTVPGGSALLGGVLHQGGAWSAVRRACARALRRLRPPPAGPAPEPGDVWVTDLAGDGVAHPPARQHRFRSWQELAGEAEAAGWIPGEEFYRGGGVLHRGTGP